MAYSYDQSLNARSTLLKDIRISACVERVGLVSKRLFRYAFLNAASNYHRLNLPAKYNTFRQRSQPRLASLPRNSAAIDQHPSHGTAVIRTVVQLTNTHREASPTKPG